jgi:hypothetical protein
MLVPIELNNKKKEAGKQAAREEKRLYTGNDLNLNFRFS